jgi:hypothetical protein
VTAPAGGGGHGEIPVSIVASVTVMMLAVLAAVVYLTATGKDVSTVILVLSSLIAPTVASFIAIRRLSVVSTGLTDVSKKVDGKVDNLITDKSNLEQQVVAAGMTPVTAKVSFDPDSTTPFERIRTDTAPAPAVPPGRVLASDVINREHPDFQGGQHG